MNIQGKVIMIGDVKEISDKFRKRDIVIEHGDNPQYLQNCIFEAHQDKVSILDDVKVGDNVSLEFNLQGRKWTNPQGEIIYFNTLAVWKIESTSTGDSTPTRDANDATAKDPEWMGVEQTGDETDLPFILTLLISSSFLLQSLPF